MTKALFLDRDGTINVDHGYVHAPAQLEFIDGVFEFCARAHEHGYLIIIVTNQSGIARGYFTYEEYASFMQHILDAFTNRGVPVTDVFCCPDLEGEDRKPNPGLFLKAQRKYDIDMGASVSVGDKERDIVAARRAGCGRNILFSGNWNEVAVDW